MKAFAPTGVVLFIFMFFAAPIFASQHKIKNLCEIHYPSDESIEWECVKLKWKDTPFALLGEHWQDVLRFNRLDRRHFLGGRWIKVPKRLEDVRDFTPLPATYPDAAQDEKFILVDQSEMFLGAYEYGRLVFSFPVAIGIEGHRVPSGEFRIDAIDRRHKSNLYTVEEIGRPYPMHYGLRFYVDKSVDGWPSFWIHGRDVPGYPASHGCIGLYDEEMQKDYYGNYDRKVNKPYYHELKEPYLEGAKELYRWVIGSRDDTGGFQKINHGPRVLIIGTPPL
ncbi:MAG TPA: L,D-transpeptidase [Geobacteraceae bacterium]|nr:L,D-transpeptidase [Geobacteraceae bacterium]